MRFKETEVPTRFDMAHYDGHSSLAYSFDPAVRPLDKANYVS